MPATYQDVVRANGASASWAFAESGGTTFAPWLGGSNLVGSGTFAYQQAGPFAGSLSLHVNVGAKLTLTPVYYFGSPITWEWWMQSPAELLSSSLMLQHSGTPATNGGGVLMLQTSHKLMDYSGNGTQVDSGQLLSVGVWHLVQVIYLGNGSAIFGVDGAYSAPFLYAAHTTPSPNTVIYCGSSAAAATSPIYFAYPTIYPTALSPINAYAQWLAQSDPTAALDYTLQGQAQFQGDTTALLAAILDRVTVLGY